MRRTDRLVLAVIVATAICAVSRAGGAAQAPPPGVECSWTCHCARHLDDCDREEAQWEACVDTLPTRHPQTVESCDRCRQLAQNECRKRTCPPDPQHGSKFPLEVLCDGRPQALSAVPPKLGGALVASPSVARREAATPEGRYGEGAIERGARGATTEHRDVRCTFDCACAVATGLCDDREKRSRLCIDKAESTRTARDCGFCYARAWVACNDRRCPLVGGTTKVLVNFACPAT